MTFSLLKGAKKFKVRLKCSRNCSVWFVTSLHWINPLLHWTTWNCIYLNQSQLVIFSFILLCHKATALHSPSDQGEREYSAPLLFQVDKPESLLKQRMYNNRCRANSDPTVSYIIVRLYLTAIVSIELQESLDAFNDWFQHFHHNIPVSQMFCSCLFFAGFQIDMRFLQIVFFFGYVLLFFWLAKAAWWSTC